MHEWCIRGPWYHAPTKLFGALHGDASWLLRALHCDASWLLRDCLFWTTYNYQLQLPIIQGFGIVCEEEVAEPLIRNG